MCSAEFGDAERQSAHQLLMQVDEIRRNSYIQERRVRGNCALVLVFVAMGGNQVRAIDGAIDGDFTLRAAADGADLLALGGAKSGAFSFSANRTGHGSSARRSRIDYDTPGGRKRQKGVMLLALRLGVGSWMIPSIVQGQRSRHG